MKLTWARSCLAFAFGCETGRRSTEESSRVKQTAAVVVWRGQRVCRVGRDGMMRGRCLGAHCQAAPKGTTSLHFHTISDRQLVLNGLFLVHSCRGGGRGRGTGIRGDVFRWGWGEIVEGMRTWVGRRCQRRDGSRVGTTAARVTGAGGVQAGLTEVTHRPGVMVGGRERCFSAVQPGNTGAVYEVWSADLTSRETSWEK